MQRVHALVSDETLAYLIVAAADEHLAVRSEGDTVDGLVLMRLDGQELTPAGRIKDPHLAVEACCGQALPSHVNKSGRDQRMYTSGCSQCRRAGRLKARETLRLGVKEKSHAHTQSGCFILSNTVQITLVSDGKRAPVYQ